MSDYHTIFQRGCGLRCSFCLHRPGRLDKKLFGISIQYSVKTKLYLSSLGGRMTAEIPFVMTHHKASRSRFSRGNEAAPPIVHPEMPNAEQAEDLRLRCAKK